MPKTIIVSNRLPIEFKIKGNAVVSNPSIGGLATGLKSVHEKGDALWVGWSGLVDEDLTDLTRREIASECAKKDCATVLLTKDEVTNFYLGFSNKALWPLFHYFLEYTEYEISQFETYKLVNDKFADVVLQNAADGDHIWIHDYQLLLLPQILRDKNPTLSIGFFLHIPFPAFEIFRTCPWREELLNGILGADVVGFHTYDYVQHFLNSVKRIVGCNIKFNEISHKGRAIKADSFPMGIDYDRFHNSAKSQLEQRHLDESGLMRRLTGHSAHYPNSKLILSIDRMDYTKGIPSRLLAFEYFLEKYPHYIEKVRLLMVAVPSRSDVPQYLKLKREIDELVGRINGKFATIDWTPIWYFYRSMSFEDLVDLYSFANVALITPLRDGMNLVAKEFVASRTNADGVLILSEMAGAASEMHEALLINPNNTDQLADALRQALEMSSTEQRERITALQKRLSRYTVEKWADDFIKALKGLSPAFVEQTLCLPFTKSVEDSVVAKFEQSNNRLLLLDYDGTLVQFCNNPEDASPDPSLYELLDKLNASAKTEVVVISGRGRESIERWFGHKNYTLITDHGVWMRKAGKGWLQIQEPRTEWKDKIRPIMESFVDRTPGAFIEEKQYSLAWHFRKSDADMSEIRTRELKILLTGLVVDNGLSVLDGDKVLEIKNTMVNKGRATATLLTHRETDFIFAVGDDHTDEFMFAELPETAITVKVGRTDTCARYHISDSNALRALLARFALTD